MERLDKIREIIDLLSGKEGHQDIIVINTFHCQPGEYNYNGKVITELEKQELEKRCKKLIIFTLAENKTNDNESVSDKNQNITVDSPGTAETFLKLRGIKM
jgi:hypothetical protein